VRNLGDEHSEQVACAGLHLQLVIDDIENPVTAGLREQGVYCVSGNCSLLGNFQV